MLQNYWFLKLLLPRYCSKHYSMWKPNHEHVPRNLPLQIFFLQLQLCNIRLVMVHHLQVHKITHKMIEKNRALNICWNLNLHIKLTRSLHLLSLLRNPYPHQFHLENRIQNLVEDAGQPWTGQFKVGLPPVPSGVRRTLCQPWPHPGYRCKARIWNCIPKQNRPWLHSCHHQLLLHVSGRQVDPRNLQGDKSDKDKCFNQLVP